MSDGQKIILGSFDSDVTALIVPRATLMKANATFDAERQKREQAAARAKLRIMQDARARAKLKRAIAGCRWHQKGR